MRYLYEQAQDLNTAHSAGHQTATPATIAYSHIDRGPSGAGVESDERWRVVPIKERIGRLNARIQAARALYKKHDDAAYENAARSIVSGLRDTWESFVEQELLGAVVVRFERHVHTQKLKTITDIKDADVASIELGMTVGSRYMEGHASPVSDGAATKTPEWLEHEMTTFVDYRASVLKRREKK